MKKIYVEPEEVWDLTNYIEGESEIIAENEDYGTIIYLDATCYPVVISVEIDDINVVETEVLNSQQCEEVVEELYDEWLTQNLFNHRFAEEEQIRDREEELFETFDQLICDVLGEQQETYTRRCNTTEIVGDLTDHVLEYLYDNYGLEPYRPMILIDEAGREIFEEYPYSKLL